MVDRNKLLFVTAEHFTKSELPSVDDSIDSIMISGYASTIDLDRQGDVVPAAVWERGLENYLKNPVILAYHDHREPVGRMVEHKIDKKGLWIKARISAAAEDVFNLVKDGVLTAFSIGFRVVDAEYNQTAEVFVVKELELHEISVVAVPANQNTLFSLSKAFTNADEYKHFKMHFAPTESAKGLVQVVAESAKTKEIFMNPEELKQALADAARQAAEEATKQLLAAQERAAQEKSERERAERELEARIKQAVAATVETTETGAEKLLAEVEKRLQEQSESSKKALEGLESIIREKTAELEAIQRTKMQFGENRGQKDSLEYQQKERAVLLSKMTGKSIDQTKFGRDLIEKVGAHLPSATWELEVSLRMEDEVRRRLVVAPTMRSIQMQTNVMTIPVNPETGTANWVTNAQFGTANSAGGTTAGTNTGSPHLLKEITLNAYKVATNEYLAYEEEEDSLLALMPVVRDAMVRRVARAVDRAFLRGAGAGSDPVKGLVPYDAVSAVNLDIDGATVAAGNYAKASIEVLRLLRKDLGAWGLDPAEIVYIVSTEVYYDLLDDANFLTVDKAGPNATILTGQIGTVGNSPVLVSAEFDTKAAGNAAAICFAPSNFIVGNQRGLRMDTQDLVETQRKVMVASLRTGMTQVTTNLGAGVSVLRYVA